MFVDADGQERRLAPSSSTTDGAVWRGWRPDGEAGFYFDGRGWLIDNDGVVELPCPDGCLDSGNEFVIGPAGDVIVERGRDLTDGCPVPSLPTLERVDPDTGVVSVLAESHGFGCLGVEPSDIVFSQQTVYSGEAGSDGRCEQRASHQGVLYRGDEPSVLDIPRSCAAMAADGRQLAFGSSTHATWLTDLGGTVVGEGPSMSPVVWSPDSSSVAGRGSAGLLVWDVATGQAEAIASRDGEPVWSPDSRRIAVVTECAHEAASVVIYQRDMGWKPSFYGDCDLAGFGGWSHDGARFGVQLAGVEAPVFRVIDAETGDVEVELEGRLHGFRPAATGAGLAGRFPRDHAPG